MPPFVKYAELEVFVFADVEDDTKQNALFYFAYAPLSAKLILRSRNFGKPLIVDSFIWDGQAFRKTEHSGFTTCLAKTMPDIDLELCNAFL